MLFVKSGCNFLNLVVGTGLANSLDRENVAADGVSWLRANGNGHRQETFALAPAPTQLLPERDRSNNHAIPT